MNTACSIRKLATRCLGGIGGVFLLLQPTAASADPSLTCNVLSAQPRSSTQTADCETTFLGFHTGWDQDCLRGNLRSSFYVNIQTT
jgi:hypothetical protein